MSIWDTGKDYSGKTWLQANTFEKVVAELSFRVETFYIIEEEQEMQIPSAGQQTLDWLSDDNGAPVFNDFSVGDTIEIDGVSANIDGTYLISEKPNNSEIRVTDTNGNSITFNEPQGSLWDSGIIRKVNAPAEIVYDSGFPENAGGANYNSPITNQIQRWKSVAPTSTAWQQMQVQGVNNFTIDVVEIRRDSVDNTLRRYNYTVRHTMYFRPFILPNELPDLEASPRLIPVNFQGGNCLKHSYRVRAMNVLNNPNDYVELVVDGQMGNTGFENENYNQAPPTFTISNINFDNPENRIAENQNTVIDLVVNGFSGNPADDITIFFFVIPDDNPQAQQPNTFPENFMLDICEQGNATGLNSIIVNASRNTVGNDVNVSFEIDVSAANFANMIGNRTDKKYICGVNVNRDGGDEGITHWLHHKPEELVTVVPEGALTINNTWLLHPKNDFADEGQGSLTRKNVDEVVFRSLVTLDHSDVEAIPERVKAQIVATDGSSEAILHENDWTLQTNVNSFVGGAPFINDVNSTGFNVLPSELRHDNILRRRTDLESGNDKIYEVVLPVLMRWEYWETLILSQVPGGIIDANEPNNGVNNFWQRLDTLTGWSVYFRVIVETQFGESEELTQIELRDYEENPDWINETITVLDAGTPNIFQGQPYFSATNVNTVRAEFTWDGAGSLPALSEIYMVFHLIEKETGTWVDNWSYSSVYDRRPISIFSGGNGFIILTNPSGTIVRGEAEIDPNNLPGNINDFTLYATIGHITDPPEPPATGACCDETAMICVDGVTEANCEGDIWYENLTCEEIVCGEPAGVCCIYNEGTGGWDCDENTTETICLVTLGGTWISGGSCGDCENLEPPEG